MKTAISRIWFRPITALAMLSVAGCGAKIEQPASETLKKICKIEPTGNLRIRNLNGSIWIRGTDRADLQLEAVKKASSAAHLANLKINVVAQNDTVDITTSLVRQKNKARSGAGSVDYSLVVPRTIRVARVDVEDGDVTVDGLLGQDLRVNIVDGTLTLRNCCANVHATIANGGVDFAYGECEKSFSAVAQLTSGNAALLIPRGAPFRVRAKTTLGKITNELAETVELNGQPTRVLDWSLRDNASSEIKLRVTTGDIRIAEVRSSTASVPAPAGPEPKSKIASSAR